VAQKAGAPCVNSDEQPPPSDLRKPVEVENLPQSSDSPEQGPTTTAVDRIVTVDLLRGVALFGILTMNIVSFALPASAYRNPMSVNGDSWVNHFVYSFFHIFADQKFMGLFSLLFGVSTILFIEKLKATGRGFIRYHYSRTLWLLAIGYAHGIFLWSGDILFLYASCGLVLILFYRAPPAVQFFLGALIFLSAIPIDNRGQEFLSNLPPERLSVLGQSIWTPDDYEIAYETAYINGPYWPQVGLRFEGPEAYQTPTLRYVSRIVLMEGYARAFGLMLIGMAFYSWGIVTGEHSRRFYRAMAITGIGAGAAISGYGLYQLYAAGWEFEYSMFAGMRFNHVATLLMDFGYVGLLIWLYQSGCLQYLLRGLAAVGRMAFTNYLSQSLICTSLFYGFGLGLFAKLTRLELVVVVLTIWTFQFYFSRFWLTYFRYGPLEWIWRTLTYFRPQPMRRRTTE